MDTPSRQDRAALAPGAARAMFRSGLVALTSGWCDGFAQANLIVVPRDWAFDVLLFAQRNPKPCPVLGVLESGVPFALGHAPGHMLVTDLPNWQYQVP